MKYVKLGVFTGLALAISWAERFIPFMPAVPGMKLGLANIILILVLEFYGLKAALTVNVVRALLAAALYGGVMSLPYSLCGGVCAVLAMSLLKKIPGISLTGVGVGGAFVHNLAQISVACLIMQTPYIFTYLPFLGITAVATGIVTGVCARISADILKKQMII